MYSSLEAQGSQSSNCMQKTIHRLSEDSEGREGEGREEEGGRKEGEKEEGCREREEGREGQREGEKEGFKYWLLP